MAADADEAGWTLGDAVILDPIGLHARPAVKLVKLAKSFAATIEIRPERLAGWTSAKSPNAVMKLRASHAERLLIRAAGEDAAAAVQALVALIERDFDG